MISARDRSRDFTDAGKAKRLFGGIPGRHTLDEAHQQKMAEARWKWWAENSSRGIGTLVKAIAAAIGVLGTAAAGYWFGHSAGGPP